MGINLKVHETLESNKPASNQKRIVIWHFCCPFFKTESIPGFSGSVFPAEKIIIFGC